MRRGVLLGLALLLAGLFASPTEQASAQSTQVLVSNLGQPDAAWGGLGNDHAQAFTTGSSSTSYTLSSVDMQFGRSAHGADLSNALTATIQSDSGGNPSGTIVGTLTNPAFVSTDSDRTYTFTAPGDGIELAANTTYWFVLDVDSTTVLLGNNGVRNTNSDDDDIGGAPGWSIADDSRYRGRGSTGGWTTFEPSKKIRINGVPGITANADGSYTVPENWALTPSGLNPGDKFRLLFQTSTRRDATSTDIAVYDTYVQVRAAAGHTAIQPYSSLFKVVGSTASVDARDHTSTTGTGHPIYWLNGPRVAANYAGFWSDNWENWATTDRRKEDGTQGDNDWHWTGTDEDGTKHSNPLGNTGTDVRRGQFSTGASSRNPISHWNTDKTQNHSFYALSPVFRVPVPAPTGPVPAAFIALVPVKENYGDDSLKALYYNEEPHDAHELDWHATKETTPLTFRVEHVQWPYNERGVGYDITFNIYVVDEYRFVGGTRYIPDTYTLPANQVYVDIALPVTPRGNNNSGPVTIHLMAGSQKPGELGRYITGRRELTYFVLDGADSGLGADDTTTVALHQAAVTRNAVLHTTPHSTEYRAEGRAVAFDIELRGVDTGVPLASIAPDMKVYYKVIGCEGIIKGGSQTQIGGVGNVIDSFTDRNGFARFAVGQSKITVTVPTVNDNVDEPDCNLQVAVTDSDHNTLPEGGKPYVFTVRDVANNPNYYKISYASKPFSGGRLNDKFFAPPFDQVGICDCDGGADDGSMITHGEVYQYEIAVSELQSGHEGEPVYFQLQAKLFPGDTLPAPLDVSVTISSEGDIGVPTSTQTVTIPVGGRVTLPAITTTDDADGIANSSVTATINQSGDYVIWPERGSATVELTESDPWPNVSVEGYIGIRDGEDHEGHYVFFEFTAEDPIPTEALDISVTTTVLGDFGITESTQTVTFDPDDEGYAEIEYLTTDDNVDEPDGEVTVTINPGQGYVVDQDGYDTSTVEILDNDAGPLDGKKAKDNPLVKYADLINEIKNTYIQNHADDSAHVRWKRVLKAFGEPDYMDYIWPAYTSSEARQLYTVYRWSRWEPIGDALAHAESYYAAPAPTLVITISGGAGITEGGTASYTITANPAPTSPITVNVGVSETGSFGATGATTVSVSGASTTYTVTTSNDNVDEADGSVTATVQSGSGYTVGSPSSASVNVADNDVPVITISGGSGITEGGSASYTITSTPAPASPITVNVALVETGNWGATGSTTVAVSGATTTYTVTTAADDVDETDGSIEVVVQSGTDYTVGTPSSATVNVADNDDPTPQVAPEITITGGSGITEGGTATFTISANPAPPAPITVNIGVSETGSFGASGASTVNVSAATTTYTVTTSDDDVDEPNGSVTATVQSGDGYTVGAASTASVSVADNDDPAPTLIHTCQPKKTGNNASLTDTPLTITEQGGVRTISIPENGKYVCLKLDNPGGSGRQIWKSDVFTIGGEEAVRVEWTEDNKVSFIYARFLDDNAYTGDRETATVRLADGSKQWKAVIVDDETGVTPPPPATPVITISGGSGITEGGSATFTISANPAPASPITVNVGVSESGNWGASGASTVTISAATTTYTIATSNDNVDEANGSVTATIQSGTGYTVGSPSSASVNVADNDVPPPATPVITVSGGSSITEGGTATFTITANPAPASPITVNIGVSESGSWGASGPTTVTVSGGTTTYTVSTTNDNVDEPNGSVTAAVQSGNGYTVGSPSSASVSVADNDDTPPPPPATPVITISGGAGITEGGSASFTITASPAPASPITVNIGVSESGSWGASGPTTVTVSGGTTTYTVSTSDDDVDEPNGSVTVRMQSGVGYSAGRPASAAVSVADNDDPPEVRAERTQLTAQVTALRDKYAKLQHNSLTHRGLYLRIEEVLKALKGQPSSLDTGWLAPSYMRGAINTATGFGDTQAAEALAEARDFLGIRVLN